MSKFNPKIYLGKDRIYRSVPGTSGIQRIWKWDGGGYNAGKYEARRYNEMKRRVKQAFDSLAEARDWQQGNDVSGASAEAGPNFGGVINEWQKRMFPTLAEGTKLQYEKLIRLYISKLAVFGIYELTPSKIDEWVDELKVTMQYSINHKNRKSFDHELSCLTVILKYYENYHDDPKFKFPIKPRHRDAVKLSVRVKPPSKDISEEEFELFLKQFSQIKNGDVYANLAIVQFHQALRISEAAALYWEDLKFDENNSRIKVVRSAFWPRKLGVESYVKMGFKNSKSLDGLKEQPMFPETHAALVALRPADATGLVFKVDGRLIEYRHIQHAYDRAFRLAKLPYTATHIMRHGGTRRLFNERGDLGVAQQVLGNSDMKTVMVYAVRSAKALTDVSDEHWSQSVADSNDEKKNSEKKGDF